jgi:hypothetical protein
MVQRTDRISYLGEYIGLVSGRVIKWSYVLYNRTSLPSPHHRHECHLAPYACNIRGKMLGTLFELILIFNEQSTLQNLLLGALAKWWRATICFYVSACPSLPLFFRMEQLGYHWTDFPVIWYLSIFPNSVEKSQISLKSDKNNGTLFEH